MTSPISAPFHISGNRVIGQGEEVSILSFVGSGSQMSGKDTLLNQLYYNSNPISLLTCSLFEFWPSHTIDLQFTDKSNIFPTVVLLDSRVANIFAQSNPV